MPMGGEAEVNGAAVAAATGIMVGATPYGAARVLGGAGAAGPRGGW